MFIYPIVIFIVLLCLWWYFQERSRKICLGNSESPLWVIPYPTEKPKCPSCDEESEESPQPEPPLIEQSRGKPRSVDTSNHYCPNPSCKYHGWIGRGNIRSNGHPNLTRWRQLQCIVCGKYFMETRGTIFYRSRTAPEDIWRVLMALAEGLGIHAIARVFGKDPNTVLEWLYKAAAHMEAVSRYLLHDLELTQIQVDELWALLGKRDEMTPQERNRRWIWTAVDPVSKLLLASVVGDRSQEMAQSLIHAVARMLLPGCIPLFLSDQ